MTALGSIFSGYVLSFPVFTEETSLGAIIELNCPDVAFKREINSYRSVSIYFNRGGVSDYMTKASVRMRNNAISASIVAVSTTIIAFVFAFV